MGTSSTPLMSQQMLNALITLRDLNALSTVAEIRSISGVELGNTSLHSLATKGFVDKQPAPGGKGFAYKITKAGREEIQRQLELAPLEQHPISPIGKWKGSAKKAKPKPKPAPAPPPPPNLSGTAEELLLNVSAVLEENARLRDLLTRIHKLTEKDVLYGADSSNNGDT